MQHQADVGGNSECARQACGAHERPRCSTISCGRPRFTVGNAPAFARVLGLYGRLSVTADVTYGSSGLLPRPFPPTCYELKRATST